MLFPNKKPSLFLYMSTIIVGFALAIQSGHGFNQVEFIGTIGDDMRANLSYGERCNSLLRCNLFASLECNSATGLCDCIKDSYMIYQESSGSCVGHHLEYYSGANQIVNCFTAPTPGGYQRQCVRNGTCHHVVSDLFGFCHCSPSFVPRADKTCGKPVSDLKFGHECNSTFTCSESQKLICSTATGRCGCKFQNDLYDSDVEECKSREGDLCGGEEERRCVKYARCLQFPELPPNYGICKCEYPYTPDGEGRCSEAKPTTTETPPTTKRNGTTGTIPESFTTTILPITNPTEINFPQTSTVSIPITATSTERESSSSITTVSEENDKPSTLAITIIASSTTLEIDSTTTSTSTTEVSLATTRIGPNFPEITILMVIIMILF